MWLEKKRSHSIFVLIYNDIYHFVWSNKIFKKGTLTCTIDTTYGIRGSHTGGRKAKTLKACSAFSVDAHNLCPSLFSVFTSHPLLLLQSVHQKFFSSALDTTRPSSFFFQLSSSLSGHNAGSQLVQMSHKTKRRRRRVIDGKIITGRHYWRRRRRRKQMFY